MLNRLSVNVLLNSVVAVLAAAVVVMLSIGAWDSVKRLGTVSRIAGVTEASGYLFTALHNMRFDRSSTTRDMNAEQPSASLVPAHQKGREIEVAALKAGLAVIQATDFPGQKEAAEKLDQGIKKLMALHRETGAVAGIQYVRDQSNRSARQHFVADDEVGGAGRLLYRPIIGIEATGMDGA
jgi:hypothetical protein